MNNVTSDDPEGIEKFAICPLSPMITHDADLGLSLDDRQEDNTGNKTTKMDTWAGIRLTHPAGI